MSQVSSHVDASKQPLNRRAHGRHTVRSLAYVELGEGNGGIVLNVSEGGIAVQAVASLMNDELPCVRVQLAYSKKRIEAKGHIAWTSGLRKTAGIEFVDLSLEARRLLQEWVTLEAPSREFVEEITEPTEKSEPAETARLQKEPPGSLPELASSATNPVAKFPDLPLEVKPNPGPILQPRSNRDPSVFRGASIAAAPTSPAPPAPAETPAALRARGIPAAISGEAAAASAASPAHGPELSGLASLTSASPPPSPLGFEPVRKMATPETPSPAASAAPEQRWKLPVLVGLFAVVSLTVGWFAGHGALHGSSKNAASDTSPENEAAENSSEALPVPTPDVSNIEVVDLNNQHWLVPMQGPLGPSPILTPGPTGTPSAQLQQNKTNLDAALPAPVHVQPRAASREDTTSTTSLPASAQSSGGSEGALPASAAANSRPAISIPSPVATSPNEQAKDLLPGKLLRRVEPAYPQGALDRRIEGTVTLYAVIDADGTVKSLKPLNGPSALVPAAVAAVRQWQYSPSLLNGRPIQTERRITIVFQLSQSQ